MDISILTSGPLSTSTGMRDAEGSTISKCFESNPALEHKKSDDLTRCNEAYLWSLNYSPPQRKGYAAGENFDLRQWGYVFWDHARLSRIGIFEKLRQPIECVRYDGWDGSDRREGTKPRGDVGTDGPGHVRPQTNAAARSTPGTFGNGRSSLSRVLLSMVRPSHHGG
jgi:hypothetical protein